MTILHNLRNAPWLARLALLWFALTLGAAEALVAIDDAMKRPASG